MPDYVILDITLQPKGDLEKSGISHFHKEALAHL